MSTGRHMDRICILAVVTALLISVLFMNGAALGIQVQARAMGYEDSLFDTSRVHTLDIVIDDWDAFLTTAQSEEYSVCDVVIDGTAVTNVGIRGKGNTSLSTVASMDSDRYSFKIEFDHYDSTKSYHGLDKLCLNNLIQDNTMMKDYLTYQMMHQFGVATPLCSYVYITVNGEDWGLYLAVEGVEESFLQRNYGSAYGELYKPDSLNMGGGRGNGKDFDFEDFDFGDFDFGDFTGFGGENGTADAAESFMPGEDTRGGQMMPGMNGDPSGMSAMQGGSDASQAEGMMPGMGGDASGMPAMPDGGNPSQEGFDPSQMGGMMPGQNADTSRMPEMPTDFDFSQIADSIGGSFTMGSGETTLQYIDDDPDSYSTIFDSAKTDVTNADQQRLIASLKNLSAGTDLENTVDVESVIRYFVVHNYVVNGDSYTGSMVHNYYLYEENGVLSMIPWDYNLAFGTFQGNSAGEAVNDDIDAPLSVTGSGRPMIDWILNSGTYTELYHQYFREFLNTVDAGEIIAQAKELIDSYVQRDPTRFCTYEEFETGVQTLEAFCELRNQSVAAQLAGETATVDASGITLSDMGTMNNGIGGGQMQQMPGSGDGIADGDAQFPAMPDGTSGDGTQMPQMPGGQEMTDTTDGTSDTDGSAGDRGQFPQKGDRNAMEQPGGMTQPGQGGGNDAQNLSLWIFLGASVLILAMGLIFAFKFRR